MIVYSVTSIVCRHNILLDSQMMAKVADFGFVTPAPLNIGGTAVVTAVGAIGLAGTRGYTAPEYTSGKRGPLSDVYSYGVVSLSLLSHVGLNYTLSECRCVWKPSLDSLLIPNRERKSNWYNLLSILCAYCTS